MTKQLERGTDRHVVRSRGWRGAPPKSDAEARSRIIEATMRCIGRYGPTKTSLSDVATEVGVTRQTVYRYFADTEELLTASAYVGVEPFFDRLMAHTASIESPTELLIESVAYAIERLPRDPYLSLLLVTGRSEVFAEHVTSPTAMAFGHAILQRFPIDWKDLGLGQRQLDDLVEFLLRILQSFVLDPGHPVRRGKGLRDFLRTWVGPPLDAQLDRVGSSRPPR
jgi:AcrR family transcriptional regulator